MLTNFPLMTKKLPPETISLKVLLRHKPKDHIKKGLPKSELFCTFTQLDRMSW